MVYSEFPLSLVGALGDGIPDLGNHKGGPYGIWATTRVAPTGFGQPQGLPLLFVIAETIDTVGRHQSMDLLMRQNQI
jgi:hypothetical protein